MQLFGFLLFQTGEEAEESINVFKLLYKDGSFGDYERQRIWFVLWFITERMIY